HCHVEAAEHMQMGMLGNLYVRPAQNRLAAGTVLGSFTHQAGNLYVYNDGDGSTAYDVEFPIQIGSFDRNFHEQHIGVQPLPFAEMHDDYPLLNGRGYPDTVDQGAPPPASDKVELADPAVATTTSQPMNSRIVIPNGKKALLRISNLNVTRFYTLATTGLPMQVVGTGAHILRGPADANMYYTTNSVTLGGGEGADVLINTAGIAAGTYLLYSTNLEALSNGAEDFGGMMTEIQVCPGAVVNGACAAE
ncbi:MAG: multicopper oxidase family protein, partial [Gammaproteobacteria bacterium]|nr:multicopper oxidase family protein [Gammaproteobacteria bacterium]